VPPPAGKLDGLGVADTAHRWGEGATLVLEEVDPHAMDAIDPTTAMNGRSAK
jgi:hypothetical protein